MRAPRAPRRTPAATAGTSRASANSRERAPEVWPWAEAVETSPASRGHSAPTGERTHGSSTRRLVRTARGLRAWPSHPHAPASGPYPSSAVHAVRHRLIVWTMVLGMQDGCLLPERARQLERGNLAVPIRERRREVIDDPCSYGVLLCGPLIGERAEFEFYLASQIVEPATFGRRVFEVHDGRACDGIVFVAQPGCQAPTPSKVIDDRRFEAGHEERPCALAALRLHSGQGHVPQCTTFQPLEDRLISTYKRWRHRQIDVFREAVDDTIDLRQRRTTLEDQVRRQLGVGEEKAEQPADPEVFLDHDTRRRHPGRGLCEGEGTALRRERHELRCKSCHRISRRPARATRAASNQAPVSGRRAALGAHLPGSCDAVCLAAVVSHDRAQGCAAPG